MTKPIRPEDSPTAWFCMLEQARIKGDPDMEAKARAELRRLGVDVTFKRRRARRQTQGGDR